MCISQYYELINYEPFGLIIFVSTMGVLILLLEVSEPYDYGYDYG